jgi:uncharacterized protein involved in exopolysaccharide biosynthesis
MMRKSNDYLRNFFTIFFARKFTIGLVALAIGAGAILFALLYPPIYGASASVILKGGIALKNPESIERIQSEISTINETDLFSEIEIIQANVVAEMTAQALMNLGFEFKSGLMDTPEKKQQRAANQISAVIEAGINPRSNTIAIQTSWNNPQKAKTILEVLLEKYLDYRSQIFQPREAEAFFADQLEKFSNELQQKENELNQLTRESQTPIADSEMQSNLLNMKNLERQLFDLKQAYYDQKFRVDLMEADIRSGETSYFSYINDPQIQELSNLVLEIIKQRNETARIFHPESKKIQNYDKQIEKALGSFKKEISKFILAEKSELENINQKISFVENQIKALKKENMGLFEASAKSKMLERQIAVLEDSYTTFSQRLEESKISNTQTNRLFSVSILARPEASDAPVFPDRNKVIFMGILAGIILGIAAGFLVEFFDHTFKSPEDVENNTGMVYIFSIPE